MTDNIEKIKVINFLINKFTESKTSFENDYLYNVLKDIRKDYQEPVSEELEKEVDEYILDNFDDAEGRVYVLQCAHHFAEWQKQQIMTQIQKFADKGHMMYNDFEDDSEGKESELSYWDGFKDCAEGIKKEIEVYGKES